jgi:hypothetical protein
MLHRQLVDFTNCPRCGGVGVITRRFVVAKLAAMDLQPLQDHSEATAEQDLKRISKLSQEFAGAAGIKPE